MGKVESLDVPGHSNLREAVTSFAERMLKKLHEKEAIGWYAWDDDDYARGRCSADLRRHVKKGDPVDVANYCMFLWNRGMRIKKQRTRGRA